MNNNKEIFKSLIAGGHVGTDLGAILTTESEDNSHIAAIAGEAILATLEANEEARRSIVPVYVEEDGILYEYFSGGEKKFIKILTKPTRKIPANFKMK